MAMVGGGSGEIGKDGKRRESGAFKLACQFNLAAAILHRQQPCLGGTAHRLVVDDAKLQPDAARTDGDGFVDHSRGVFGAAEDIDPCDGCAGRVGGIGGLAQRGVAGLAQDAFAGMARIDRHDAEAVALQEFGDFMAGPFRPVGQADHGYGLHRQHGLYGLLHLRRHGVSGGVDVNERVTLGLQWQGGQTTGQVNRNRNCRAAFGAETNTASADKKIIPQHVTAQNVTPRRENMPITPDFRRSGFQLLSKRYILLLPCQGVSPTMH
ncbi:hypothetical protein CBM2629_A290133 [Cupriavidus taiwanensis]|nr:hypothetical protein CBM2629_A290133 [Cupriavidus taiwanensis]